MRSLPIFLRLSGRPVILLGDGEAADAKRRLLARAGARIVDEFEAATIAVVAIADEAEAAAAIRRLKARGLLVNAVDRADDCDFTLPAIVDRDPVTIAIGTDGASAGLAAALRQRLEALLPGTLGGLAAALHARRGAIRARWPEAAVRRQAIAAALGEGGALDPFADSRDVAAWLGASGARDVSATVAIRLRSGDPDELTLREARLLARADRIRHAAGVPAAILDRARVDAARIIAPAPLPDASGLALDLDFA